MHALGDHFDKTKETIAIMTYELQIETSFAAAHNLLNYCGQCEKLHGHNWKVEVKVRGSKLDKSGMLLDFKILKNHTETIMESLDHCYLNEHPAFAGQSPSSELIARYIFTELEKMLSDQHISVYKVTAWESDRAAAAYMRD
jgi:6-pyruvoyltetrahydropterin/6-carboxytetrahydropterin synthase